MKERFSFKKFIIDQNGCAMKVGTDGVLLGAWTSLEEKPETILDIGAGTGLIALMLAQRSLAETIDALEVDPDAYEQCVENFEASPWGDRLFCYHADLEEFIDEFDEKYDLIISNPPFYSEDVSSGNTSRDNARQNRSLPFELLLGGAAKLLNEKGKFATIIPFREENHFLRLAAKFELFPMRKTHIKGNPSAAIKRSLLEFGKKHVPVETDELTIELKRHQYTPEYIALTKDFYLKM